MPGPMTETDWALLEAAHKMNAVDNQLVKRLIPLAETEECKGLLKIHYSYLEKEEKEIAGVL